MMQLHQNKWVVPSRVNFKSNHGQKEENKNKKKNKKKEEYPEEIPMAPEDEEVYQEMMEEQR
jgi:hypothetical protein